MPGKDKPEAQRLAELEPLRRRIAELEHTEKRLQESEARLRIILEHTNTLFYSHTADNIVTYVSPQVEDVLGRTVEDAMVNWTEFITDNPENEEGFKATMKAIETGERQPPYELEVQHGSGRIITVEVRETPVVENGKTVAIVGALTDITDRKQADKELQESRQRLQTIFESSGEYLILLDTDHNVLMINRTEPGLNKEDVLNLPLYSFLPPDDQEYFKTHLDEVAQKGKTRQFETDYTRIDGKKVQFMNVVSPIMVSGEVQGSVLCAQDVTEIRHLESQYHQAQKVESIGRLAGGVAHDLNNLLSPVIGYGEMLLDDLGPKDRRRESVDQILQAGFRARDLVRQLLAFSRKQTLEYKPVDMNQAVAGIENLLRRTIREDVSIEIITTDDIPPVMADIGQLDQVILNLAVNAQDAMTGGGTLTIKTGRREVQPGGATGLNVDLAAGPWVLLTIKDTGCGMNPQVLENVFEPFFSTKGEQGTGLGLATVYGIVKQHGGNIIVESEPEQGSTFFIYLPASVDAPEDEVDETLPASGTSGSETILLVEDSDQVRRLARKILERRGYQVLAAEDGRRAKAILTAHDGPVHLLLTDVVMPRMNGKELYRELSADNPGLKVLYMSGYADDVIAHQGVLKPGVPFIHKPFTINTLSAKVRQVLGRNPS